MTVANVRPNARHFYQGSVDPVPIPAYIVAEHGCQIYDVRTTLLAQERFRKNQWLPYVTSRALARLGFTSKSLTAE